MPNTIINENITIFLKQMGAFAHTLGHELYIVGGYVRDTLYEKLKDSNQLKLNDAYKKNSSTLQDHPISNQSLTTKGAEKPLSIPDLDLVINTNAIKFIEQYKDFLDENADGCCIIGMDANKLDHEKDQGIEIMESFDQFKTIKIKVFDSLIELASSRTETYKEAAAFPTVELITSVKEDLQRRDFTINALLQSLMPRDFGDIIDHVNAISDLQKGLIRVFHDDSFIDDPTRMYRAARFAAKLGFQIEEHTLKLMQAASKRCEMSSWLKKRKSRFQIELDYIKQLNKEQEQQAFNLLRSLKILN